MKDYHRLTDTDLISACLAQDRHAWEALIKRYSRLIYSLALGFGLSQDDATETFQSVCVILLEKLSTLKNHARLSAWLITTTKRECWRMQRLRTTELRRLEDLQGVATQVESKETQELYPEHTILMAERQDVVRRGLDILGGQCQKLLQYLYYEKKPLSHAQISAKLKLSPYSIGRTRARCLQKLKRILQKLGHNT
jgi:RNA polymerase sigma factor (sigma-70 family)